MRLYGIKKNLGIAYKSDIIEFDTMKTKDSISKIIAMRWACGMYRMYMYIR